MNKIPRFISSTILTFLLSISASVAIAAPAADTQTVPIKKIALLPVENPWKMFTQNRNILGDTLGGFAIQTAINQEKTKQFSAAMEQKRGVMGKKMTAALLEELTKAGYEVRIMDGAKGPPDDPDDVEYKQIPSNDPVLHLWFDTTAMYSSRLRSSYEHQVNVSVRLVVPKTEEYLYDESLYYGAESKGEKYWSIPGDPKYQYANFDELMAKQDEVMEGFDASINAIARHISKEFSKRFPNSLKNQP